MKLTDVRDSWSNICGLFEALLCPSVLTLHVYHKIWGGWGGQNNLRNKIEILLHWLYWMAPYTYHCEAYFFEPSNQSQIPLWHLYPQILSFISLRLFYTLSSRIPHHDSLEMRHKNTYHHSLLYQRVAVITHVLQHLICSIVSSRTLRFGGHGQWVNQSLWNT